jgi:hypothetical protein
MRIQNAGLVSIVPLLAGKNSAAFRGCDAVTKPDTRGPFTDSRRSDKGSVHLVL